MPHMIFTLALQRGCSSFRAAGAGHAHVSVDAVGCLRRSTAACAHDMWAPHTLHRQSAA